MTTLLKIGRMAAMIGVAASLGAGHGQAKELPILRPAKADYAKICKIEPAPAVPANVDWSTWKVGSRSASPAQALAYARMVLDEPDIAGESATARTILEKLAANAPTERATALFELAALDLFDLEAAGEATIKSLRRSLALGNRRAAILLGQAFEEGLAGQERDPKQAELFYKLAVQARLEDGALKLASLATDQGDAQAARQWLSLAQQMMAARLAGGDCSQLRAMASLYLRGDLLPRAPEVAAEWLDAARRSGDAQATRLLAIMLLSGDGVAQDIPRGLDLLQQASNAGDVGALVAFGRWHRGDYGGEPDPVRAREYFEKAAAAVPVNLGAWIELGRAYRDGLGAAPDPEAAERMFKKAAQAGSMAGFRELAWLALAAEPPRTEEGLKLLRDAANRRDVAAAAMLGRWLIGHSFQPAELTEAVQWLNRASARGHIGSAKVLGRYYFGRNDPATAARYWRIAAKAGDAEGLVELAALQHSGAIPVGEVATSELLARALKASERDPWGFVVIGRALGDGRLGPADAEAAYAMFRKAADRDEPSGLRETGLALARGDGVAPDQAESRRFLERAAVRGDLIAQVLMGRGLAVGWFGEPDPEEARKRLEAAAHAGSTGALLELGALYSRGVFGAIDPEAAVTWWRAAAKRGDTEAMRELANAHAIGFGVPLDPAQSVLWLERAAARGDGDAMRRLAYMYLAGVGVEADDQKAEHWTKLAQFSAPLPNVQDRAAQ